MIRSSADDDLLPDRPHRQLEAGHEHHRLEAAQRIARRVRVDRRQRAVVTRVHRLEHVERLGAADLADDDAVGPHAQRVAHEVADRDLALALDVLRARLEPHDVPLLELQLGRVLDRDDPVRLGIAAESAFRSVVLPEPVPPEISMLRSALTQRVEEVGAPARTIVPIATSSSIASRFCANFRIVSTGPRATSGGMTAFTREPSGSRASTIGDDSSMRRPTWPTILLMIRRRCDSSVNAHGVSESRPLPLDPDLVRRR